jgi:hypothetical protein
MNLADLLTNISVLPEDDDTKLCIGIISNLIDYAITQENSVSGFYLYNDAVVKMLKDNGLHVYKTPDDESQTQVYSISW